MSPYQFPFALLTMLMLVAIVPVWAWFVTSYPTVAQMPLPMQFLVGLSLPATIGLALVSHLQPGG